MNNNVQLNTGEIRRTSLCKCGKKAEFIKDYWVTEEKVLKEKGAGEDDIYKRNVESVCGIMRRRFCAQCFSSIATRQRRVNKGLNTRIILAVMLPFLIGAILGAISFFAMQDVQGLITFFGCLVVGAILTGLVVFVFAVPQKRRKMVSAGDFSDPKAIDALLDSLNFGLDDPKKIKDMSSLDVVVDGDGRVNYDMERAGYKMKIVFEGKISFEPMRQRILYPFKEDCEYIKRTYTNADLLEDNVRIYDDRELTEKDFDIRGTALMRYSGLAINILIPENVTKIGVQAFKNSKNCESVVIPAGVTEIDKEAFSGCPATVINLPEGIKKISSFCFYNSAIKEMIIPEGVEEIEDNAFCQCYSLEKVIIPSTCKKIGEAAFKGCSSLASVEIGEGVESLGDYCFNGCSVLTKIAIPDGCCELGNFCFEGCAALTEVYLPETIQFVGGRVFEGCTKMSIYGKEGSYAHSFADQYRLRFTPITESRYKKPHKARKA